MSKSVIIGGTLAALGVVLVTLFANVFYGEMDAADAAGARGTLLSPGVAGLAFGAVALIAGLAILAAAAVRQGRATSEP